MYAAKAVVGAVIAGIAVLIDGLTRGQMLHLVNYLMAINAALAGLAVVFVVPNKGTGLSDDDIARIVAQTLDAKDTKASIVAPVVSAPVTTPGVGTPVEGTNANI